MIRTYDGEAALDRLYGEGRYEVSRAGAAAGEREDDLASEAPIIRLALGNKL